MNSVLSAQSLTIGYPGHTVAGELNLDLPAGRLVCLLGPNGAGKSTLLRTLCGMQSPLAGRVTVNGTDIHSISPRDLARLLSVVLTEKVQVGLLSAYELVCLGRYPYTDWSGRLRPDDHRIVRESIEAVGAQDLAARPFHELSDGERQKVMMARALAQQPKLLVLDEITAFLDLPRRVDIMRTLRRLAHEQGATILLSTHDLDLALRSADELWLLEKGGAFHRGAPEDLVLDGSFGAAFRSEGIEFNEMDGQFELNDRFIGEAWVDGAGKEAVWTKRALERIGLRNSADAERRIRATRGSWILEGPQGVEKHLRIESLVESLRKAGW